MDIARSGSTSINATVGSNMLVDISGRSYMFVDVSGGSCSPI